MVTLTDSLQGCLEAALDEIGAELNVMTASSEFMSVLSTAASAPVIATVPARMARRYGLTLSPMPLKLNLPPVSIVWSAQLDQDAASSWIRRQVAEILLAPEPTAYSVAA